MSKNKRIAPPVGAKEAAPPVGEAEKDTQGSVDTKSNTVTDDDEEKQPELKREYPCVAPKASILGQGDVFTGGMPIAPGNIHSDPDTAKEHFDRLVKSGHILTEDPKGE